MNNKMEELMKEHDKKIRNKTIEEFAEKVEKICGERGIGVDPYTNRPTYASSDGTWHDLLKDVIEQMKEIQTS